MVILWEFYKDMASEILTAHHGMFWSARTYEPDTLYLREIKTYYEELFSAKGKTITYIKFRLKNRNKKYKNEKSDCFI